MLRLRFIIGMLCVMCGLQAAGQTSNPFELKWKSGATPPPAIIDTPVETVNSPSVADITTPNDPEEPMAPLIDTVVADPLAVNDLAITDADSASELPEETIDTTAISDLPLPETESEEEVAESPEPPPTKPPPAEEKEKVGDLLNPILPGPTRNVGVLLILTMLGLSILVLTWAVNANRGFIRKIYRAAMNENLSALLLREQKFASLQYLYYIVYATFFINASLFLFLISRYAPWNFGSRTTPLMLFVGVLVGIYLTRHIFMRLLGSTFGISNETTHYNFNILLYNILAGIALIPINLFLAFGPEAVRMPVIYGGLGMLCLLYLIRQLRGLNIASHIISANVFQFFVYLCAVEILPVLVLYKYFITD